MSILIAGANSFIASKLVNELKGELYALINNSDNRLNYGLYNKVYRSITDLLKSEVDFDFIYLVGSFIPYKYFNTPNRQFITSNIELVAQLSNLYPQSKIIFFSSISVYGLNTQNPITETSYFHNPNLYGLSKIAGEAIIRNHNHYAILRISSVWGKGIEEDTFIPRLVKQAKETNKISVFGNGLRQQNYIHYDDVINMAILAAENSENGVYLTVAEKSVMNILLAEKVAAKTHATIELIGTDNTPSLIFDATKSYATLQYKPQKNIVNDIEELL